MKCFKNQPGQSLVEVLVAVGAMSLLLVSLLALISLSVRNTRMAKDRAQAVALAQGGVELMRAYRDYSWSEFSGVARVLKYDLPNNWTVETGLGTDCNETAYEINDFYRRCVQIVAADSQEIEVVVEVAWREGSQEHLMTQETRLAVWKR